MANKSKNDVSILKSIFIITLSIFLILNLIFATPSQMMMSSLVYATSNNSESAEFVSDGTNTQNEVPGEIEEGQQNTENDSSNNNLDTNIGLFDSGSIDKNILKGKDVSSQSIETAYLTFSVSVPDGAPAALISTISICIETVGAGGSTIQAIPHCFPEFYGVTNVSQKFLVEPGQMIIEIKYSPELVVSYYDCDIKYLVPKESKRCRVSFDLPTTNAEVTPKPNSDFGKSMIGQ